MTMTMTGRGLTFMGAFFGGFGLAAGRRGLVISGGAITLGALGVLGAGIWRPLHSSVRLEVDAQR